MVSSDNKDDPNKGGSARPQVTLDLKAKSVGMSAPEAPRQATSKPAAEGRDKAAKGGADNASKPGQSEPRRSRGGTLFSHLMASVFGGVIAVGVAYFTVEQFRDSLPILTDTGAATLRNRLGALERRMNTLEFDNKPSGADSKSPQAASDPQLQEKVAAANSLAEQTWSQIKGLEQRLAALEGHPLRGDASATTQLAPEADGRVRAEIEPLKSRVDSLDKTVQGINKWRLEQQNSQKVAAVSSALGSLRHAFDQGKPYEGELRAVVESSPISLDLSVLASRQSTGVETQARLVERFNKASKEALSAVSRSKGGGIVGEAFSRVQSAVRVKPSGSELPEGQEPEAVIARMEARLKAGDLSGAIREGQTLKDPAAAYFGPWLTDAETRATGLDALNRAEAKLAGAVIDAERSARRGG